MVRRLGALGAWLAVVLLAGCADTGPVLRSARAQQHTAVVLAYLDTLYNRHDAAQAAHLYLGAGFVDHSPAVATSGNIEVLRSVSQGDLVAVQSRVRQGARPERPGEDGRPAATLLIEFYRLYKGRIVDRWAMADVDGAPENPVPMPARPIR